MSFKLLLIIFILIIHLYGSKQIDVVYSINQKIFYEIVDNILIPIQDTIALSVINSGRSPVGDDKWGHPTFNNHNISDIKYLKYFKFINPFQTILETSNSTISSNDINTINMNILNSIFYGQNKKSLLYDLYEIPFEKLNIDKLKNSALVPALNSYLCIQHARTGFYWLTNDFKLDLKNNKPYINFIESRFVEEDHRLLRLYNDNILLIFTTIIDHNKPFVNKVGIRYLNKTIINNKINYILSNQIILYKDNIFNSFNSSFEKNWTPFNYYNKIFLIQSFQPFLVYKLDYPTINNIKDLKYYYKEYDIISYQGQIVTLISSVNCPSFSSYFGKIRGGSQAMLIRGQYLGFYHTYSGGSSHLSSILPDNIFYYFIGAYTFTKDIPFKFTSISKYPITHDSFIRGEYKPGHVAWLTYAMSYVLIDKYGKVILEGQKEKDPLTTTIVLTIGLRDSKTIIAKMNLNELFDSMKPIIC